MEHHHLYIFVCVKLINIGTLVIGHFLWWNMWSILHTPMGYYCSNGNLQVTILFPVDVPDPYLVLSVPKTPNRCQRTQAVGNSTNPRWDKTFYFYVNPDISNDLCKHLDSI